MKTNRREFMEMAAVGVAVVSTGSAISTGVLAEQEVDPNEAALAALAASPYSSAAMPSLFSPMVDATAFENHTMTNSTSNRKR